MSWVAVGVGAASLIGGVMSSNSAKDSADASRKAALGQYANLVVPTVQSQEINLNDYQNAGTLSPAMQQQIALGNTNLSNISTDPRLQSAQMQALAQVSGMASGNPSAGDQAGFELARQNVAGENQAKQNQIMQDMEQRGQAGSGAELLARLKGNQVGDQTLATQQLQQAQAMQQDRMAALAQQSNMSTSIRGQNYGEQSALANAKDQIAKYNAANAQSISNSNTNVANAAQATNLQNAQNLSNVNTATQNDQQKYNKQLIQTNYQNQVQKAGGSATQLNSNAAASQAQAANTAAAFGQAAQGIGQAYSGSQAASQNAKNTSDTNANNLAIAKLKYGSEE